MLLIRQSQDACIFILYYINLIQRSQEHISTWRILRRYMGGKYPDLMSGGITHGEQTVVLRSFADKYGPAVEMNDDSLIVSACACACAPALLLAPQTRDSVSDVTSALSSLLNHRLRTLRTPIEVWPQRPLLRRFPEQGAHYICAPIPYAYDLVFRIIHPLNRCPRTCTLCPRFRSVDTRLASINQAHPLFIFVLWGTHIGRMTDCAD